MSTGRWSCKVTNAESRAIQEIAIANNYFWWTNIDLTIYAEPSGQVTLPEDTVNNMFGKMWI